MMVAYNLSTFTSVMLVTFDFDNGVKTFRERKEAERVETTDIHFIVITSDGEWIHYPKERISNLQIQTLIRANYHE
ncbi:hypothetical protein [Geosporobacter ferrireducens]|uniref:hypothetical protein n=1 Tax=Geosporobacter ferrireducens TaxID=1424294 RepID=UPI00139E1E75|nr:hypothetical protein [Geosporobacter ferrireducens]MTI53767.1 hypothetical protein [Geosporobacter ferrireducens]